MLKGLRSGNLVLMRYKNNSELSPLLKTCISINLENHNSLFVELREVRYITLVYLKEEEHNSAIRFVDFF